MAMGILSKITVLCMVLGVFSDSDIDPRIEARIKLQRSIGKAKNVIFFLGDGMGVSTVTAMRIYKNQLKKNFGENDDLYFERFPYSAIVKSYSTSNIVADSASTATAFMTGENTKSHTVNVDDRVIQGDCKSFKKAYAHDPIVKLAKEAGKSVGVVTTARLTHSTPATAYANSASSEWEDDSEGSKDERCPDIARQFVEQGQHIDVMFAGGRARMLPNNVTDPVNMTATGRRQDNRNLIKEWLESTRQRGRNCSIVYDRSGMKQIDPTVNNCALGLFATNHMEYELIRQKSKLEPSLTEMTEKAINILSQNDDGFFLFVEGARIDHAHHASVAKLAITEGLELEKAVKKASNMTTSNTLIIVTADHSQSLIISGYANRSTPILGLSDTLDTRNKKYTILLYATGPGYVNRETTDSTGDTLATLYKQESVVSKKSGAHSGEDVTIYARGPWAHLIGGVVQQTYVHEVMKYAACLGEYRNCDRPDNANSATVIRTETFIPFLITLVSLNLA